MAGKYLLIFFQLGLFLEPREALLPSSPPSRVSDDLKVKIETRAIGTNLSFIIPSEGYCMESQKGRCKVSDINKITVEIPGLGSHSFTANSDQLVSIGTILLNLTNLTPNRDVPFLFTFSVDITYTIDNTFTLICSTFDTFETRQVLLQSGICTSLIRYVTDSNTLTWEKPNCMGWENALDHYNLKIESKTGVYEYMTSGNSFMIPAHINGTIFTTVVAENVCGEKTELNIASFNVEVDAGYGDAEEHGITPARAAIIAVPVSAVIMIVILMGLIAAIIYKTKKGTYNNYSFKMRELCCYT